MHHGRNLRFNGVTSRRFLSLASGRVKKDFLFKLDTECRKFLGHIAEVPNQAVTQFFYADRSVGGLGTFRLSEDADIWTLARATQLLSSNDPLVRGIFKEQLCECVRRGFREGAPDRLPISEFLSGSNESGPRASEAAEYHHIVKKRIVLSTFDVHKRKRNIPGFSFFLAWTMF